MKSNIAKPSNPKMDICVNGQVVNFLIDTGSSINVISNSIYERKLKDIALKKMLCLSRQKPPVQLKGKFLATLETKRNFKVATIYVTADDGDCLLSSTTAQELGLVSLNLHTLQLPKMPTSKLLDLEHVKDSVTTEIIQKHKTVFSRVGKLKDKQITLTIEEIKEATQQDRTLRALRAALKTGCWNMDYLKPYQQIKDEITIDHANNLFLRGTRIILPASLQTRIVQAAHQGHQGISKTTALLREYVWFPKMGKLVKSAIDGCLACQSLAQPNPPEPLQSTPMPHHPWEHVKIDFCGPFPSGNSLLVIIDCYSRFPEVEILKSTTALNVIPKLDAIFARHGIPAKLTSDNGPPFQSEAFKRYVEHLGIQHHHSTPLWPQGNSEVEAFNKPLEKAIKAAHVEHRP